MFRRILQPLTGLMLLALPFSAQAQAYSFSDAPVSQDRQLSLGFDFSTTSPITISSLGYFDHLQDGFLTPHEVGIYDASGTLLTSTLLSAGIGDTLDGKFRYKEIVPFVLPAGQTFTLAATTYGEQDAWAYGYRQGSRNHLADFTTSPDITISNNATRYLYQDDNILRFPTFAQEYTVYAGPNFKGTFRPAGVPAPSALITLFIGVIPGAILLRRRRKA